MLTDADILALQELQRQGQLEVCEYIKVTWDQNDSDEDRYYATSAYREILPFIGIGFDIEPKIMGDPFREMELYPDLRTDEIKIKFEDIDKTIRDRFIQFGSGVRIEFFLYYPQRKAHHSTWFGQLQAPEVFNWRFIDTTATNGFRSREQKVPKRMRPRECTFTFGGLQPPESMATNGCPYDRDKGGVNGLLNAGDPFTDCPRDETACNVRFGHLRYFGGFKPDAAAVVTDQNTGYLARSKGNASQLKNPIPVVAGRKTVRKCQQLFGRREVNYSTPEHGFVALVAEVCEGPIQSMSNLVIGEKLIESLHWNWRPGNIGQGALTQYAPDLSNFSGTAHLFGRLGWVNAAETDPFGQNVQVSVEGYRNVITYGTIEPGYGVVGEYFQDTAFANSVGQRVDSTINFPQSSNAPVSGVDPSNGFSVRWSGKIKFPSTANVTFTCYHDDEVFLQINGSTVITNTTYGTHTGNFSATADVEYDFTLELVQQNNGGFNPWGCILQWAWTGHPIEVVPYTAFTHEGATGYIREFNNNRAWWVLELYTNQKFGMSYPLSRFNPAGFADVASWTRQGVRFSYTNTDGEVRNHDHVRTQFDCIIEGRPISEQIVDICRAGRITIPYQENGLFTMSAFRAFTQEELDNAKVFYDKGENKNIEWSGEFPMIEFSQTPDDKIPNEITVTIEDGANGDNERPVTGNDPNQQLRAGRTLGENNLQIVPKKYAAFGTRYVNEAIKLVYGFLRFGEFDEGGTHNNGTIKITVPLIEAIGLKRYGPMKVRSELLTGFELPGDGQIETFRVRKIRKTSKDTAEITAQAYNHSAYVAFETIQSVNAPPDGDPPDWPPIDPPLPNPDPLPPDIPIPMLAPTTIESINYNAATGMLEIEVS